MSISSHSRVRLASVENTTLANGVAALNAMAIDSPADAMRAIQLAIREQRVALGEPTDRTAVSIEDTIKREYERWMVVEDDASDPATDQAGEGGAEG